MNEDYINEKLNEIFFPIGIKRRKEFRENHYRLAYYTTEETAKKILQNKEIWMRNASVMNDYSEIQYGIDLLKKSFYNFHINNVIENMFHPQLAEILIYAINDFFGNNKMGIH